MKQERGRERFVKRLVLFCMMMILSVMCALPVAAAPKIKETECEKKGIIQVDFRTDVIYKNPRVTVKDSTGKKYKAVIVELDDDDMTFRVKNYRAGKKYTYKISGVCAVGETSFHTVKGTFRIPKKSAKPVIQEVSYDAEDREVEFDFTTDVRWKNAKVTISHGGKQYVHYISDKDHDGIDVYVKALKHGKKYSYKISGVSRTGQKNYVTVTGSFIA